MDPTADVKLDPKNLRLENNWVIHWVRKLLMLLLKILKSLNLNWFLQCKMIRNWEASYGEECLMQQDLQVILFNSVFIIDADCL